MIFQFQRAEKNMPTNQGTLIVFVPPFIHEKVFIWCWCFLNHKSL